MFSATCTEQKKKFYRKSRVNQWTEIFDDENIFVKRWLRDFTSWTPFWVHCIYTRFFFQILLFNSFQYVPFLCRVSRHTVDASCSQIAQRQHYCSLLFFYKFPLFAGLFCHVWSNKHSCEVRNRWCFRFSSDNYSIHTRRTNLLQCIFSRQNNSCSQSTLHHTILPPPPIYLTHTEKLTTVHLNNTRTMICWLLSQQV